MNSKGHEAEGKDGHEGGGVPATKKEWRAPSATTVAGCPLSGERTAARRPTASLLTPVSCPNVKSRSPRRGPVDRDGGERAARFRAGAGLLPTEDPNCVSVCVWSPR